ncbi:unnamed protein product [Zymoseptoria tritici ST99CH_1A5]|uniref:Uncharacterized protein n=1 Tax=Zymoseptoria tritici ST99CH_1A5 TaxID=1276529 RepID=A0A1Y6LG27_ZYMTR|nr:unnamed protein product [Zymoseptoria tritici ST99CH_1A5]
MAPPNDKSDKDKQKEKDEEKDNDNNRRRPQSRMESSLRGAMGNPFTTPGPTYRQHYERGMLNREEERSTRQRYTSMAVENARDALRRFGPSSRPPTRSSMYQSPDDTERIIVESERERIRSRTPSVAPSAAPSLSSPFGNPFSPMGNIPEVPSTLRTDTRPPSTPTPSARAPPATSPPATSPPATSPPAAATPDMPNVSSLNLAGTGFNRMRRTFSGAPRAPPRLAPSRPPEPYVTFQHPDRVVTFAGIDPRNTAYDPIRGYYDPTLTGRNPRIPNTPGEPTSSGPIRAGNERGSGGSETLVLGVRLFDAVVEAAPLSGGSGGSFLPDASLSLGSPVGLPRTLGRGHGRTASGSRTQQLSGNYGDLPRSGSGSMMRYDSDNSMTLSIASADIDSVPTDDIDRCLDDMPEGLQYIPEVQSSDGTICTECLKLICERNKLARPDRFCCSNTFGGDGSAPKQKGCDNCSWKTGRKKQCTLVTKTQGSGRFWNGSTTVFNRAHNVLEVLRQRALHATKELEKAKANNASKEKVAKLAEEREKLLTTWQEYACKMRETISQWASSKKTKGAANRKTWEEQLQQVRENNGNMEHELLIQLGQQSFFANGAANAVPRGLPPTNVVVDRAVEIGAPGRRGGGNSGNTGGGGGGSGGGGNGSGSSSKKDSSKDSSKDSNKKDASKKDDSKKDGSKKDDSKKELSASKKQQLSELFGKKGGGGGSEKKGDSGGSGKKDGSGGGGKKDTQCPQQ